MKTIQHYLSMIICAILLTACGSSGGNSGGSITPTPPVNIGPNVNAGANQTVDEGVDVTVTGTASDSDGTIASVEWTQVSGPTVSLSGADTNDVTFTAPNTGSAASVSIGLRFTATDDDNAARSADVTITVNSTNVGPSVDAGTLQAIDEQSNATVTATASDPDGSIASFAWTQIAGTSVTLADANTATASFTAPSLSVVETLTFSVTVTDDRGATATATADVQVNPDPALNTAPTANAGTDVTGSSATTVSLDASASSDSDGTVAGFSWTQTAGTTVTLTNADTATPSFTAPTVTADETFTFEVTVTDNEGATATDTVVVTITPQPSAVKISGTATFDNVGHTVSSGLDYNNITQDPIAGAQVELLQNGAVIQTLATDAQGAYLFEVDPNTTGYTVRILSRTVSTATAKWEVNVVDNTNGQALYSIVSSGFDAATTDITRPNMNAGSGWGGSSYTGARVGGAFHVLARIYEGVAKIVDIDPDVNMPAVDANWSPNNSATGSGSIADLRNGNIGTSFYTTFGPTAAEFAGPQLFILGAENSDTDEYDGHVVVHEWGHYFENNLSRSDSIGGSHTGSDRLDMRLAFGEGFGNAWSGMMTDDSFYRDSRGSQQGQGFSINVENNTISNKGWYNEASVQAILYDIYDSVDDSVDTLSLGLEPIYNVLVGPQRTTDAFTSIFSFSEYFRDMNATSVTAYNSLLAGQDVSGTDRWGTGETNDANAAISTNVLPVYTELTLGAAPVEVCSIDDFDTTGQTAESGNKLSNFRFIRFNLTTTGSYIFNVSAGATQDPDMEIYLDGTSVAFAAGGGDGDPGDAADSTFTLNADNYVAEAYEFDNTFRGNTALSSDECFTVQIVSN